MREDQETIDHILSVLKGYGAVYRFGAPLDLRWLSRGWSAHLEFSREGLRIRTDFVCRPPRLSGKRVSALWDRGPESQPPFLGIQDLIQTKKTNREKDYVVIGELARLLTDPRELLLNSRSARELVELVGKNSEIAGELEKERPLLACAPQGLEALESALDAERRALIHANEKRLERYLSAAKNWAQSWPEVSREMAGLDLQKAHEIMTRRAEPVLPFEPPTEEATK